MKLTLAEPTYLKDSISIISELVNEARFNIRQDALELVAMDPANVAMVIFKLLSSAFVEFSVEKEQQIAVNLQNFKQILRRAKPNDVVTLELDRNQLKIQLKAKSTRTFNLPLIEFDDKEQKIPELNFSASVKTSSARLSEAIEDAEVAAESVAFVVDSGRFCVSADGDLTKAHIELQKDDNTLISLEDEGIVRSKYAVEYLKKMINGAKLASDVEILIGPNYPLRLDYKTVDKVALSFILAPRVDND